MQKPQWLIRLETALKENQPAFGILLESETPVAETDPVESQAQDQEAREKIVKGAQREFEVQMALELGISSSDNTKAIGYAEGVFLTDLPVTPLRDLGNPRAVSLRDFLDAGGVVTNFVAEKKWQEFFENAVRKSMGEPPDTKDLDGIREMQAMMRKYPGQIRIVCLGEESTPKDHIGAYYIFGESQESTTGRFIVDANQVQNVGEDHAKKWGVRFGQQDDLHISERIDPRTTFLSQHNVDVQREGTIGSLGKPILTPDGIDTQIKAKQLIIKGGFPTGSRMVYNGTTARTPFL